MKKPRSLDHDGLDGVLPSLDKARLASGELQAKSGKALKKPKRGNVPWLVGVVGLLALVAVLAPKLSNQPEPAGETLAQNKPAMPAEPAAENSRPAPEMAAGNAGASANPAAAEPTPVAEAKSDPWPAAEPEQASIDGERQAADAVAELPTEPTAAGVPNAAADAAEVPRFTVYFKFDSGQLAPQSAAAADELLAAAQSCPRQIRLVGHTCNLGTAAGNLALGRIRANAVKKQLVARGISKQNIVTASEGMARPAAPNETKAGQALNRRVELHCLGH
ncbi:OmpA family protein [Methylomonas koyamae]|uniref:OmpA-like domain-containing protein n=1 Tax=Methylomonas koyamae TaxID=702114 RepID=A0AA91DFH1_9GAMM|nr:OmpA family protein [Methylomonas koyamae]OAI29387.1 hypothetical protein A1356_04635 [Methylomonas koyamae]